VSSVPGLGGHQTRPTLGGWGDVLVAANQVADRVATTEAFNEVLGMIRRLGVLGASGDLPERFLLPALAQLSAAAELPDDVTILGRTR
jgi:hypothetical protein